MGDSTYDFSKNRFKDGDEVVLVVALPHFKGEPHPTADPAVWNSVDVWVVDTDEVYGGPSEHPARHTVIKKNRGDNMGYWVHEDDLAPVINEEDIEHAIDSIMHREAI